MQVQPIVSPLSTDERLARGDEFADAHIAITLAPVSSALGIVEGSAGQRMVGVNVLVAIPADLLPAPSQLLTGPNGEAVMDPKTAAAFAGLSVRLVVRRDALSPAAQEQLARVAAPAPRLDLGRFGAPNGEG